MADDLENVLKELITQKPTEAGKVILKFASKNEQYRYIALEILTQFKYAELGLWLKNNWKILGKDDWECISREFFNLNFSWRDTGVLNAISLNATNSIDPKSRHFCLVILVETATLATSKALLPRLDVESDEDCRRDLYRILSRYKYSDFDTKIQKAIVDYNESYALNGMIELSIKDFNRYDLLPDLYSLRSRLQKVTDVTKKSEAKETLEILKQVIPYLEQKKAEKAPIGLPLDWGK